MYPLSRNHANGQSVVEKELCNSTAKAVCEAYLTSIFRHIFFTAWQDLVKFLRRKRLP